MPLRRGSASHPAGLLGRLHEDRGATAADAVIIFPIFLLIIFGAVQAGVFFYGRSAALAAAQQGLQAARVQNGDASAAADAARRFLQAGGSGGGLLSDANIIGTRTATTASVTVSGTIPSLVPGATFTVSQTAAGTVERVTTSAGGGAGT